MQEPKRGYYLAAYDISDHKIRRRAAKLLLGYTTGRQKSVYECWLTKTEKENLIVKLEELIPPTDKCHLFKLPTKKPTSYLAQKNQPYPLYFIVA